MIRKIIHIDEEKGNFGRGKFLGRSGCGVWEHIKVQLQ